MCSHSAIKGALDLIIIHVLKLFFFFFMLLINFQLKKLHYIIYISTGLECLTGSSTEKAFLNIACFFII